MGLSIHMSVPISHAYIRPRSGRGKLLSALVYDLRLKNTERGGQLALPPNTSSPMIRHAAVLIGLGGGDAMIVASRLTPKELVGCRAVEMRRESIR